MKYFVCLVPIYFLTVFSCGFANSNDSKGSFSCVRVSVDGENYVYCPHNDSLYSKVDLSEKKILDIKNKLEKLRSQNKVEENNKPNTSSVKVE